MKLPVHGGQLRELAERFNIPAAGLLDLSANINPEGPPASLVEALRRSLEEPATLGRYPDLEEQALKRSIGEFANVPVDAVSVANGFVPLLEATLSALSLRNCLLPVPAFVEYRRTLMRTGVSVSPHPLHGSDDFGYDLDALLNGSHGSILLANPQNPTGILTPKTTLRSLIEEAATRNMSVLVDEAFIDYAPEESLAPEAAGYRNLIVFRSVTKFLGVPGLRVAYAVADPELTRGIEARLPPWPITTLASEGIIAGLADEPFATRSRLLNQQRRGQLAQALHDLGIHTYATPANFLLMRLPKTVEAGGLWEHLIIEHGVVVRNCANYEALAPNHLRTAIRTEAASARLIAALRASL